MMIFNTASHGVTTVSKTFEKVPIGFQYFFIEFSCNQSWEMPGIQWCTRLAWLSMAQSAELNILTER